MAKFAPNATLDAYLTKIKEATTMALLSGQPSVHADIAGLALADVAVAAGDFTNADGDVDGRKVTIAQKSGVAIDATGTANHVALYNATDLIIVTTCTSTALTMGNTVTFPAWSVEIGDPA